VPHSTARPRGGRRSRPTAGNRCGCIRSIRHGSPWTKGSAVSLEGGKYADLAVLSDDYLMVPIDKVSDLHSVLTMVGGKVVYGEGSFAALEGK
jgi:predicted amidohydrolase YtcJ